MDVGRGGAEARLLLLFLPSLLFFLIDPLGVEAATVVAVMPLGRTRPCSFASSSMLRRLAVAALPSDLRDVVLADRASPADGSCLSVAPSSVKGLARSPVGLYASGCLTPESAVAGGVGGIRFRPNVGCGCVADGVLSSALG